MTAIERLALRTNEPDTRILEDYLESAQEAIMARRFPYGNRTAALEPQYLDLQVRIAYALYLKRGGEYESAHSENGVSRSWTSEGIPKELLSEITPYVGVPK